MAHYDFGLLDLISASLTATDKRSTCDDNNNSNVCEEKPSPSASDDNEKAEKSKPKQMVGLFPLDLRSELKLRVGGGKAGFSLKKSSTNVDVFSRNKESEPIPMKLPEAKTNRPSDLLKSLQEMEIRKKVVPDDSDDEGGQENLSFKEKLKLIERSSSRNLVNPL